MLGDVHVTGAPDRSIAVMDAAMGAHFDLVEGGMDEETEHLRKLQPAV